LIGFMTVTRVLIGRCWLCRLKTKSRSWFSHNHCWSSLGSLKLWSQTLVGPPPQFMHLASRELVWSVNARSRPFAAGIHFSVRAQNSKSRTNEFPWLGVYHDLYHWASIHDNHCATFLMHFFWHLITNLIILATIHSMPLCSFNFALSHLLSEESFGVFKTHQIWLWTTINRWIILIFRRLNRLRDIRCVRRVERSLLYEYCPQYNIGRLFFVILRTNFIIWSDMRKVCALSSPYKAMFTLFLIVDVSWNHLKQLTMDGYFFQSHAL
jgi:hypothetical protein